MMRKKNVIIVIGGILLFFIIFALWIGGIVFFHDKNIFTANEWSYYLMTSIVILPHPLIAKVANVLNKKRLGSMSQWSKAKIPWWVFIFSYILLVLICFPMSNIGQIIGFIINLRYNYERATVGLILFFIFLIPLLISFLISSIIEKGGTPQKKWSFIIINIGSFLTTSIFSCVMFSILVYLCIK